MQSQHSNGTDISSRRTYFIRHNDTDTIIISSRPNGKKVIPTVPVIYRLFFVDVDFSMISANLR